MSQSWREKPSKLEEVRKLVEAGEFECEYNPTFRSRTPTPLVRDSSQKCMNTATHVETVSREFVMGRFVYDIPLCEEHRGFRW